MNHISLKEGRPAWQGHPLHVLWPIPSAVFLVSARS